MRRHVLTYKKTETKTHTTKTPFENLRFWEPTDNRQEPPDNRQEPGDFYFWHTMSDAILETFDLYDICSEWWGDLTWPKKALRCCDIWDTDYNTDNWEPEFMTFFVTWQLIVTLDSIRNSCNVFSSFFQMQLLERFVWAVDLASLSW